jgi:hypothetical protein
MKTAFLAGALLVSATILTETQAKAQADAMARELLPSGYKHFTVDIQWYEPNAQGHGCKETAFHPNP